MSIVMGVEYQGRNYKGWQFQSDVKTVQGSIEEAISKVANEKVGVVCAGRTDTGVHATSHKLLIFNQMPKDQFVNGN